MRRLASILMLAMTLAFAPLAVQAQQAHEIRVTRQPSIIYMSTYVMERQHLIEQHAAALDVADLHVEWLVFAGGGNATDALLSGNIDVIHTGPTNLLLLWDRTHGGVKGIVASSALPLIMVSRDPRLQKLSDFTAADKIAVPTVRVSTQAVLLQMAAEQAFGPGGSTRLDGNTVQMSHPDALVALTNPRHEVATHFGAPPYMFQELRTVPGAHRITDDRTIAGGPVSNSVFFATTRFAAANPAVIQAVKEATVDAAAFIRSNPREAVEIYWVGSGDKTPADELLAMMGEPGMDDYRPQPQGTLRLAQLMYRVGTLKTLPHAWTDYFFPISADLEGS